MTFLNDPTLVASLRRASAPPGQFDVVFPGVTDAEVAAYLADGFGSSRMVGWFPTSAYNPTTFEVTPDLSTSGQALVVAYAARNIVRQRLLTLQAVTKRRYKAGPVESEVESGGLATVLSAILADLTSDLTWIRDRTLSHITPSIGDLVSIRILGATGWDFDSTEYPGRY